MTTTAPEKTTHTPGPWQQRTLIVQDQNGEVIAHCTRWEHGTPMPYVAEANARLIAAAPDLLAALKDVEFTAMRLGLTRGDADDQQWADALLAHFDALKVARAAIAKAEGS